MIARVRPGRVLLRGSTCSPARVSRRHHLEERVCVFVDGENFRKSIGDLFDRTSSFHRADYLPECDWGRFFDWVTGEVASDCIRVRTYWYVVEKLDFWPHKIPDRNWNDEDIETFFKKHSIQSPSRRNSRATAIEALTREKERIRRRFDGWIHIQDGISSHHEKIEFRRAGAITYDLERKKFGSEKAVDVKLAVDMISLHRIYDTAVILSGDQDFVPAVQEAKNTGKRVLNIAFKQKNGKLLPGGARRLNMATDSRIAFSYDSMKSALGL